ncbi:MAG: YHS domain-containing (seleno)protein [Planctomycetota bacterium]|nr:YHS domain-containing (seleno)protein [Planctomycetota bacterium]
MDTPAPAVMVATLSLALAVAGAPRRALAQAAGSAQPPAAQQPAAPAKPTHNTAQWNLAKGTRLAIDGYDPVAYFAEGGAVPAKGRADLTVEHEGAIYRFASEKNRDAFKANPERYEPAFGGWCAWAMLEGEKVEVDPESFLIQNDRLLLFYKGFLADTRSKWSKGDTAAELTKADGQWKKISGEDPRRAAAPQVSLKPQLDAIKAESAARAPAAVLETYEAGIRDVAATGILDKVIKVGDRAPAFALPNARGEVVALSELTAQGPVVLAWYRGRWCPYCNTQLKAYESRLAEFRALGATVVALSPQKVEQSARTAEADGLDFALLSDAGSKVADAYGLRYELPERLRVAFKGRLDLAEFNAEDPEQLPLAATIVVDRAGIVRAVWAEADYRNRAEPEDVLKVLRELGGAR